MASDFTLASYLTPRRAVLALLTVFFASPLGRKVAYRFAAYVNWLITASLPRNTLFGALKFTQDLPDYILKPAMVFLSYPRPKHDPWYQAIKGDGWKGFWIAEGVGKVRDLKAWEQKGREQADLVVLYAHGGGYSSGHGAMFMDGWLQLLLELKAKGLRARILSLDYGLAPHNKYPSQLRENLSAYKYLIEDLKLDSSKIIFGGDSAGGNLVSATLLALQMHRFETYLPTPQGALLISPWLTLDTSSASHVRNIDRDYVSMPSLAMNRRNWLPPDQQSLEYMRSDPYVAPLYAPAGTFAHFPPCFIAWGDRELFYDDIIEFVSKLRADGVDVEGMEGPDMPHIWLVLSEITMRPGFWKKSWGRVADWAVEVLSGKRDRKDGSEEEGMETSRTWEKVKMTESMMIED